MQELYLRGIHRGKIGIRIVFSGQNDGHPSCCISHYLSGRVTPVLTPITGETISFTRVCNKLNGCANEQLSERLIMKDDMLATQLSASTTLHHMPPIMAHISCNTLSISDGLLIVPGVSAFISSTIFTLAHSQPPTASAGSWEVNGDVPADAGANTRQCAARLKCENAESMTGIRLRFHDTAISA